MREELQLNPNVPVGHQLKARRQALRLSLAQVEIDTKIRGKFLTALESGEYSSLPNDIYSRGFVQHYAGHLGLNGSLIAAAYSAERGGITAGETKRPQLERQKRLVFTGPVIAAMGGLAVVVGVLTYLLWQFSSLAAAPRLEIQSPASDAAITGGVIDIVGNTSPGADITVNDSPVLTNNNGGFSEKVALQEGVNTIRITAQSKLGKSTTVTRNVLVRLPKLDAAAASVPVATFDGIAVAITVRETTSMVVLVDDREVFRGTYIAGRTQVFTGTNNVTLTTGNAGTTSVTVTNTVSANKSLNPLGRDGEIRRNQSFAKDTVIP